LLVDSSGIKIDLDSDDVAKRNSVAGQNTAKAAENIVEFHHQTPLTLKKKERRAIFKLLREESVNIVPKDWKGTALGWIAANGLSFVVQLHLLASHGIDEADESGRTPLSYAAGGGHKGIVKILLDEGAFIDSKDRKLRTPLSYASGHKDVVNLLLIRGANPPLEKVAKVVDAPRPPSMPSQVTKTKVETLKGALHKPQVEKRSSFFGLLKKIIK